MTAAVGCVVLLIIGALAYPFNPRRLRHRRTPAQQRDLITDQLTEDRRQGLAPRVALHSNPLAGWAAVALAGAGLCFALWQDFDSIGIAMLIAPGAFALYCVLRYGLWTVDRVIMDSEGITVRGKHTPWSQVRQVSVFEFEVNRHRQQYSGRAISIVDRRAELQVTGNAVALPFGPRMELPAQLVAASIGAAHDALTGGTLAVDLTAHRRSRASGQRRAGHQEGELNIWAIVSVALAVVMWIVGLIAVLTHPGPGLDNAPGMGFIIAIEALGALVLLAGITGLIQTRLYAEDGRRAAMFGIVAGAVVLYLGLGVFT